MKRSIPPKDLTRHFATSSSPRRRCPPVLGILPNGLAPCVRCRPRYVHDADNTPYHRRLADRRSRIALAGRPLHTVGKGPVGTPSPSPTDSAGTFRAVHPLRLQRFAGQELP